jgi:hypothetical protein
VARPSAGASGSRTGRGTRQQVSVFVLQNDEDIFAVVEKEVVQAGGGVQSIAEDHVEGSREVVEQLFEKTQGPALSSSPGLWGSASSRIGKSRPKSMA